MLNVIEPQEHHSYQASVHPFLQELSISCDVALEEEKLTNATYILVDEEIEGFQGGILLLKKRLETLYPDVKVYLETICPQHNLCTDVWTGYVAFQVNKDISGGHYEKISKLLYRVLYEDLIAFGVKENIPFLYLTMPLVEYLSINFLGMWDFMLEISPRESLDGLFHGILPLRGEAHDTSFNSSFLTPRASLDPFSSQNCDKFITI